MRSISNPENISSIHRSHGRQCAACPFNLALVSRATADNRIAANWDNREQLGERVGRAGLLNLQRLDFNVPNLRVGFRQIRRLPVQNPCDALYELKTG